KRKGSQAWLSVWQGQNEVHAELVELPGHGRLVDIPNGPQGLHLGNRLQKHVPGSDLTSGFGDDGELENIELGVHDPANAGVQMPAKITAKAQRTGFVPL